MLARTAVVALLALSVSLSLPATILAQPKEKAAPQKKTPLKAPTNRTLTEAMDLTLYIKGFEEPRKLKKTLEVLAGMFAEQGYEVPIIVDKQYFMTGSDAGAPDPHDQDVVLSEIPSKLKASQVLRMLAAQAGRNGTYLIRNGTIEITTADRASPERLLGYPVGGRFDKKPLEDVIESLCEQSGATIVIDVRIGDKARTPVSATFRNNITLEGAVRLLVEMADLQADVQENVLFITSKPKADGQKEKSELRLKNRRLDLAVRDLAAWSGKSILLDPAFIPPPTPIDFGNGRLKVPAPGAVSDQPGMQLGMDPLDLKDLKITATFQPNVSAKAAAEIIARQVRLSAVVLDNVIYITQPTFGGPLPGEK